MAENTIRFYSVSAQKPGEDLQNYVFAETDNTALLDVSDLPFDNNVAELVPRRRALYAMSGGFEQLFSDYVVHGVGRPHEASLGDTAALSAAMDEAANDTMFASSWSDDLREAIRASQSFGADATVNPGTGMVEAGPIYAPNGVWQFVSDFSELGDKYQDMMLVHESGAVLSLANGVENGVTSAPVAGKLMRKYGSMLGQLHPDMLEECARHDLVIDKSYLDELALGELSIEALSGKERAHLGLNPQTRMTPGDGVVTEKQLARLEKLGSESDFMADAHYLADLGGISKNEASLLMEGARKGLEGPADHVNVYGKSNLVAVNGMIYDTKKEDLPEMVPFDEDLDNLPEPEAIPEGDPYYDTDFDFEDEEPWADLMEPDADSDEDSYFEDDFDPDDLPWADLDEDYEARDDSELTSMSEPVASSGDLQLNGYDLDVLVRYYTSDKTNIALQCMDREDGCPYCVPTVNMGVPMEPYTAALDENNVPGITKVMEDAGFGHPTGAMMQSGFCEYPVFKFDEAKLAEIDADGVGIYDRVQKEAWADIMDTMKEAESNRELMLADLEARGYGDTCEEDFGDSPDYDDLDY